MLAGYISYKCYSFAKTWAVSLISAWAGLAAGLILIKLTFITNATLTLIAGISSSFFGAYLGKKLNLLVRSITTSVFGSYLIIIGINKYLGGLPNDIWSGRLLSDHLGYPLFLYGFSFVGFTYSGWRYQMKSMRAKSDDDYKYEPDEGCQC